MRRRIKLLLITTCIISAVCFGITGCGSEAESNGGGKITLSGSKIETSGNGMKVEKSVVTITKGGTYEISGNLEDGQIKVDSKNDVTLVMDGVNISSENEDAIHIKNGDVTIELKSENTITNGKEENYTEAINKNNSDDSEEEDEAHAAIYSKDNIVIKGDGTLNVKGYVNNGIQAKGNIDISQATMVVKSSNHGIKSKSEINIQSGDFNITCVEDGIHADDKIIIKDGDFVINANDDGIHADNALTIDNGNIDVQNSKEGLEAIEITVNDGDINIISSDDGINACGGTSIFGKGDKEFDKNKKDSSQNMKPGNLPKGNEEGERPEMPEGMEEGEKPEMPEGMEEGEKPEMPEGMEEGERPEMPEGMEKDNDSDASTENPVFTMNGGKLYIKSGGDGIDSNGDIYINAGEITVDAPTQSADSAIDYASESQGKAVINGGTVIGLGSSAMAEEFDAVNSKQCSFTYAFSSLVNAGTEIIITDAEGTEISKYTTVNGCNCIQFSSDKLEKGKTYNITAGDQTGIMEQSDIAVTNNNTKVGDKKKSV